MAEVKKYEYYEKLMKVINALENYYNDAIYNQETGTVITLIKLFPQAVKKYAEHTLSTTLKILNVDIDDYVIRAIDYAIGEWVTSPAAKMKNNAGSLYLFCSVLDNIGNPQERELYGYVPLYNFYRTLYICITNMLPEYLNPDSDDEDCLYDFYSAEDMIKEIVDEEEYPVLASGYDEYQFKLDDFYNRAIWSLFIDSIDKDTNDEYAKKILSLPSLIKDKLELFYKGIGISDSDLNKFSSISSSNMYDQIGHYALANYYDQKDTILSILYNDNFNDDTAIAELYKYIWQRIKTIKPVIMQCFKGAYINIDRLFDD